MPWRSVSLMSQRLEFIKLALKNDISFTRLCRRNGLSCKTGYKWLARYQKQGLEGLQDQSRKPHHIHYQVPKDIEQAIVDLRQKYPRWGAAKIRKLLQKENMYYVPSPNTITKIFHRHGLISSTSTAGRHDWQRFEHPVPNALWQMDFKGHFPSLAGPCHPLTVLDDHSRFNLCLKALPNEQTLCVQQTLTHTFLNYGLPDTILCDNGSPWGDDASHPYNPLTIWLIRLGIRVSHSRPYHPQTAGKDERFHRTLNEELISSRQWKDLFHIQSAFDHWRDIYNLYRPHASLGLDVPASRYKPSLRSFPQRLPDFYYPKEAVVCKVKDKGLFVFKNRPFHVSKGFKGLLIGVLPTTFDGIFDILFCNQTIAQIDLKNST